jgi:Fe-S cluster assembly iron-binding protein IscA
MVEITEAAAQALGQALDGQEVPPDEAFRLFASEGGQIAVSQSAKKEEGDIQLDNGERAVVFIEPVVAQALENHALDIEAAQDGMRLIMRPLG